MKFQYGGLSFPLTADRTNSLFQDADPALYIIADYCRAMITAYAGERILAEANADDQKSPITSAVASLLPYEPGPYLRAEQIAFPALFVHRTRGSNDYRTITRSHETTTVMCTYVLPALSPAQAERLIPIRFAIKAILADRIERGQDDDYTPPVAGAARGDTVWQYAGIERIDLTEATYGGFDGVGDLYLPAIVMTLIVKELHTPSHGTPLQGVTTSAAIRDADGTTTEPVVTDATNFEVPPT